MSNPFEILENRLNSIEEKLHSLSEHLINAQNQQPENVLLTVPQAADFLKISMSAIYALVQRSQIPYSKRGKRLYFLKSELEDWVKAGRRKTLKEIVAEAEAYVKQVKKGGAR